MTTDSRDLRETDDDGFREIQLSGKQLVFLCMATTVVSMVIFLFGVLVGRGVRPVEPVAEAAAVASAEPIQAEPPDAPPAAPPAGAAQAEPTPQADAPPPSAGAAVAAAANREAKPTTPPASAPAATAAPANAPPPAAPKAADPASKKPEAAKPAAPTPAAPAPANASAATAASAKPAGGGSGAIAVQVGALRERADADALARRLTGKGYAAYIVAPEAGTATPVYKVRVGNYTSPDEAARVKRRLEQEEKLKPWIIR